MSFRIEIHELAHEEFINAYGWYEDKQVGLGSQFANEVEHVLDKISINPQQYPKVKLNYRKGIVKGFPYVVIFELFPRVKSIHVASIRHMKQSNRGRYRRKRK